jgi:membrane fusion protein (multidrug efflux system)
MKEDATPCQQGPGVAVCPVVQQDISIYGEWIRTLDGYVNAEIRLHVTDYLIKEHQYNVSG